MGQTKGKRKKAAVNVDYKVINMNRITEKIGKDKYPNFYPRVQLFTRGVKDSVTPDMLSDILEYFTAETDEIKRALAAAIREAKAQAA